MSCRYASTALLLVRWRVLSLLTFIVVIIGTTLLMLFSDAYQCEAVQHLCCNSFCLFSLVLVLCCVHTSLKGMASPAIVSLRTPQPPARHHRRLLCQLASKQADVRALAACRAVCIPSTCPATNTVVVLFMRDGHWHCACSLRCAHYPVCLCNSIICASTPHVLVSLADFVHVSIVPVASHAATPPWST
jgi:hypothetical protein